MFSLNMTKTKDENCGSPGTFEIPDIFLQTLVCAAGQEAAVGDVPGTWSGAAEAVQQAWVPA